MRQYLGVWMMSLSLAALVGCGGGKLQINNNGPNTLQVTSIPSPNSPPLPLDIPAGQNSTLTYSAAFFPPLVNLQVADTTTGNFDVEQVQVPDGATQVIDWDGTQLTFQPLP